MKTESFFRELFFSTYKNHNERLGENPTEEQVQDAMKTELAKQPKEVIIDMLSDLMINLSNDSAFDELSRISASVSDEIENNGEIKPGG